MPRGDKTGPLGEGPRTGRGLGVCNTVNPPIYFGGRGQGFGRGQGQGLGRGRGRGQGRGYRFNRNVAPK